MQRKEACYMPEISVIVPVYNCISYLERGVDSILAQTFDDFELILVDDGSTDGSGELCDRLASGDARVKVIHKENGGAGSARNAGMDAASATYWVFPDADDWMEPNMLESLYDGIVKSGADLGVCGFTAGYDYEKPQTVERIIPEKGILDNPDAVRGFFIKYFPDGMAGYLWNKIYSSDVIKRNNIRFSDMRRYQDGMFNLDLFGHINSAVLLDLCLYHYKLNDVGDVFVKYPVNKFELLCRLLEGYEERLSEWGLNRPEQKERICSFFLRGVVSCIDSMYSPYWGFGRAKRKEYLRMLAQDVRVGECLKIRGSYGRYADLVLGLLSKKRYFAIRCIVRLKIMLKKYGKRIFLKLKRSGGYQG